MFLLACLLSFYVTVLPFYLSPITQHKFIGTSARPTIHTQLCHRAPGQSEHMATDIVPATLLPIPIFSVYN